MQTNKPFAEALETSSNGLRAQCFNNKEQVIIGSMIMINDQSSPWLAIVIGTQTGSRFPGGIQALGELDTEIENSFPELSFVQTKTLELELLANINITKQTISPTVTMPNPHATLSWPVEEFLSLHLSNTRLIKSLSSILANSKTPELIFGGLCAQITHLKSFDKNVFYKTLLINIHQSAPSKADLVKVLCRALEYFEPQLQF